MVQRIEMDKKLLLTRTDTMKKIDVHENVASKDNL